MSRSFHILLLAVISTCLVMGAADAGYHSSTKCSPAPVPAPFRNFLTYSAQGRFKPLEGPFPEGCSPEDPGIAGFVCADGENTFYKKIMGFSDEEFRAEEAKANAFFLRKFGLDVDSLVAQGRLSFQVSFADPRIEYTAFVVSGLCTPSEGYPVRDGFFSAGILDPDGIELGGEFTGQSAPQGAGFVFGAYNILITGPHPREEVIKFSAAAPLIAVNETLVINCDLEHEEWGKGLAAGFATRKIFEDGSVRAAWRNVLTFPPLGLP